MSLSKDIFNIRKEQQTIFISEVIHALTIEGRYAYSPHGEPSIEKCGMIFEDIHRASGYLTTMLTDDVSISDLAAQSLAYIVQNLSKNARERLFDRFDLASGA